MSEPKKRGRPRVNDYTNLGELLTRLGETRNELGSLMILYETIKKGVWAQFDDETHIKLKAERIRCPTCHSLDDPIDFTIDIDHEPPRVRMYMPKCKHRIDLVIDKWCKKCPECGGELQEDSEGKFCILCTWRA